MSRGSFLEGTERMLSKSVSKNSVDVLQKRYSKLFDPNNLVNQLTIFICLLSLVEFYVSKNLLISRDQMCYFSMIILAYQAIQIIKLVYVWYWQ